MRNTSLLLMRLIAVFLSISILNGFTIYASAPMFKPSRLSSSLDLAVKRIIGIWLMVTFCFIFLQSVNPSISGIMISLIIRSGSFFRIIASASFPLVHSLMWKSLANSRQMYFRISSSSSTTRTRFFVLERIFSSSSSTGEVGRAVVICTGELLSVGLLSISSAFRCSLPKGNRIIKREPGFPSLFSASIVP